MLCPVYSGAHMANMYNKHPGSHTHTNKVMDEIDIFSFESKRRGAYDLPELGT